MQLNSTKIELLARAALRENYMDEQPVYALEIVDAEELVDMNMIELEDRPMGLMMTITPFGRTTYERNKNKEF